MVFEDRFERIERLLEREGELLERLKLAFEVMRKVEKEEFELINEYLEGMEEALEEFENLIGGESNEG